MLTLKLSKTIRVKWYVTPIFCVLLYIIVVLNTQRFGSLGVDFELLKVKLVVIASEMYSIYWSLRLVVFFEKKF